jgi:hypothetical protein
MIGMVRVASGLIAPAMGATGTMDASEDGEGDDWSEGSEGRFVSRARKARHADRTPSMETEE